MNIRIYADVNDSELVTTTSRGDFCAVFLEKEALPLFRMSYTLKLTAVSPFSSEPNS